MRNDRECGGTTGGPAGPASNTGHPATPPRCPMPMPMQSIGFWAPHRHIMVLAGLMLAALAPRPASVGVVAESKPERR